MNAHRLGHRTYQCLAHKANNRTVLETQVVGSYRNPGDKSFKIFPKNVFYGISRPDSENFSFKWNSDDGFSLCFLLQPRPYFRLWPYIEAKRKDFGRIFDLKRITLDNRVVVVFGKLEWLPRKQVRRKYSEPKQNVIQELQNALQLDEIKAYYDVHGFERSRPEPTR